MSEQRQRKRRFRTGIEKDVVPDDPESLFRDLKLRAPEIQYLWSHQADLLRAYDKDHLDTSDIALELPTGSGKTLIGLLLAEYRRRKFNERAIYLCPTRQLVHQVGEHATRYGIHAHVLLTPDYKGINEYRLGSAVGITTYSSIFNTSPRISNPQVIILDDAHSAEDYIAGLWSVSINRFHREELYREILRLLRPEMEDWFVDSMLDDSRSPDVLARIDMLPHSRLWKHRETIRDLLDTFLPEREAEWYSWSMIREALHACCLFISWYELLLRPIIPPTMTHNPFANAKQRIYMSATLGESGELERTTGVRNIERLPMPEGWEKQSTGRRLFLFPNMTLKKEEVEQLTVGAVQQSKRALVLTPTIAEADNIKDRFSASGIKVISSKQIEESLDMFTSHENVALVLANRYDGIDLPDDSCRLLIIEGLPAGTNLQERFLLTRLAASSLLRDRLRTRFTQGVGRCCRNSTDFAAVLVVGQKTFDFCAKHEIRSGMHPELQAELRFGIENSKDTGSNDFLDLMQLMYEQSEDWADANREILRLREGMQKLADPVAQTLMDVVKTEVDFIYELWKRDYISALEKANQISDVLGGDEITEYRAWWYYLGGTVAWLGGVEHNDETLVSKARELFGRAAKCSKSISWFAELSREAMPDEQISALDVETIRACEAIYARLAEIGFSGQAFPARMKDFSDLIKQPDSNKFEQALEILGNLLGFQASRPKGQNAPDGVWCLADHLAIAFEAKSEEDPNSPISMRTVRQVKTYDQWLRDNCGVASDAELIVVVVSPRSTIDREAQRNAENICYLHIDEIRGWAENIITKLRRIRTRSVASEQSKAVEIIQEELREVGLLLPDLLTSLKKTPLEDLPIT